jgi:hypothetical protein
LRSICMLESRRDQGEFFVLVHVRPGEERGRAATEEGKRLKNGRPPNRAGESSKRKEVIKHEKLSAQVCCGQHFQTYPTRL